MKLFAKKSEITAALNHLKNKQLSVGLVPTMGALHQGHLALVQKALNENDVVVVSIFVNPTQFDNKDDLTNYPRTLDSDIALLKTLSEDKIVVYAPTIQDIYQNDIVAQNFDFDGLELEMEGKFRTGHFDGVGTIVKRLFDIIKPDRAYFGEKDYQQLAIIKKLVEKHHIPVTIIGCPIYREASGLAMSSRNTLLEQDYQNAAPFIYKTLLEAKNEFGTKSADKIIEGVEKAFANHDLLKLEYFTIADIETLKPITKTTNKKTYRAFIAVYAGGIRLIDNIALN